MLSIFRSAEVPFLNIISYLIKFVKFCSICAFRRTRGVCLICAKGQCVLICEALEELHSPRTSAYDSRSVIRSAGPAQGFRDSREIVAYSCIQEKNLHMYVRSGIRAGSPATGPLKSPLLLYHIAPQMSIGKFNKNYTIFLVKPHKNGQKCKKNRHFWRFLVIFSAFDGK